MHRREFITMATAGAAIVGSPFARAQDKPPLRILVGYPAGGGGDTVARVVTNRMRTVLNQTIVIENKPGVGGRAVLVETKRSQPDGNTLVITAGGALTVQPWLYKSLGYDPVKDFTPIARITAFDFGLMTNISNPNTKDLKSLIAYLKANPREANYGSPGPGTVPHFAGQMIARAAGIELTHVAYKGSAPAMTDLLGGQIPLLLDNPPVEQYKAGRLRIIAVTGEKRQRQLPDVPTLKELGMNVVADQYFALYGPAGMAPDVVKRLSDAVAEALKAPEVQERLYGIGMAPAYLGPAEIGAVQLAQYQHWEKPIKASGYVPD